MRLNLRRGLALWTRRILLSAATFWWMGLIFGFSSDTAEESAGLSAVVCRFLAERFVRGFESMSPADREKAAERLQFIVRKGAHVTEYLILGILLVLTLTAYGLRRAYALAMAAGALYAGLDEYHQRFVAGRSGEIKDVLIDACGVLLGLMLVLGVRRLMQKIKEKKGQDIRNRSQGIVPGDIPGDWSCRK